MGYKQDWTPRSYDWHPQEAIMKFHGHAWWDYMSEVRKQLGEDQFYRWVVRMARPWSSRSKFIEMMAWNDRNSEFNLQLQDILRTHRFMEGETVTAKIVAEVMESMLS